MGKTFCIKKYHETNLSSKQLEACLRLKLCFTKYHIGKWKFVAAIFLPSGRGLATLGLVDTSFNIVPRPLCVSLVYCVPKVIHLNYR